LGEGCLSAGDKQREELDEKGSVWIITDKIDEEDV